MMPWDYREGHSDRMTAVAPMPGHHAEHGADVDHTGHEQMFRRRFWVCLALSVPVLLYSSMLQQWLGFTAPPFPGSRWIPAFFSVVIFLYGGIPFLQMAVVELRQRQPGMRTANRDRRAATR